MVGDFGPVPAVLVRGLARRLLTSGRPQSRADGGLATVGGILDLSYNAALTALGEQPGPEALPLGLAGPETRQRMRGALPPDGHVGAARPDPDLADLVAFQTNLAAERAEQVPGPQLALPTALDDARTPTKL